MLGAIILCGHLAVLESRQHGPLMSRAVYETHLSTEMDQRAWEGSFNGGGVRGTGTFSELLPSQDTTSFPSLFTNAEMLPKEGDWAISVDFLAETAAQNGIGLSLHNLDTGKDLYRVHVDQQVAGIQVWVGDGKSIVQPDSAWDGSPFKISIPTSGYQDRWQIRKHGAMFDLTYDGRRLSTVAYEPGRYSLRLGAVDNQPVNPGQWSRVGFGTIRIDYMSATPPNWVRTR